MYFKASANNSQSLMTDEPKRIIGSPKRARTLYLEKPTIQLGSLSAKSDNLEKINEIQTDRGQE